MNNPTVQNPPCRTFDPELDSLLDSVRGLLAASESVERQCRSAPDSAIPPRMRRVLRKHTEEVRAMLQRNDAWLKPTLSPQLQISL